MAIISSRMRWVEHVAGVRSLKIVKKYWWENLDGNSPLEDLGEMIRQC